MLHVLCKRKTRRRTWRRRVLLGVLTVGTRYSLPRQVRLTSGRHRRRGDRRSWRRRRRSWKYSWCNQRQRGHTFGESWSGSCDVLGSGTRANGAFVPVVAATLHRERAGIESRGTRLHISALSNLFQKPLKDRMTSIIAGITILSSTPKTCPNVPLTNRFV